LYISWKFGLRYLTVIEPGINKTNVGKKIKTLFIFGMDIATFVVVDKPKYDLVLDNL
ncbi:17303_t:CDS:2, partial [Dentiscutata heterogama]